ncbi:MAG: ABC transporter permease [Opitutales bacterium]
MRRPNFIIALRFLLAKQRAMLMSLAGIVFGVAFFVVTQAQTTGFQGFFIQTILGTNGAVRIQDRLQATVTSMVARSEGGEASMEIPLRQGATYVPGIQQPQAVLAAVRSFASVTGASPVLRGNVNLRAGFRTESGRLHGIEAHSYVSVSELARQTGPEGWEAFGRDSDGLLIGRELAERLSVRVGDPIYIEGRDGRQFRFRVSGLFSTGIALVDRSYYYAHMRGVRRVLEEWDDVSYVQVALSDPSRAPAVARHMEQNLGHVVASWQERERSWLEVFRVLRISSGISMSTIILIAGLGMFNTLAIIVMERAREIAILRSIGYTRHDILRVFLYQGAIIYVLGIVLGALAGAGLTALIESVPIRIRGIFSTDHFIMHWALEHYLWAALVTGLVVLLASVLPARRAARIEPGEVIRGTSG